jgi:hypothetical protein
MSHTPFNRGTKGRGFKSTKGGLIAAGVYVCVCVSESELYKEFKEF